MPNESATNLLYFIQHYTEEHGFAPTYREMMDGTGAKSKSTIHGWIAQLESHGRIKRMPGNARALRVLSVTQREDR
jgi:repressor LexA